MHKQGGVAAVGVVLILAIVVAGGAGIFAWQKMADSDRYQAEARTLRGELEKARADLRKATADAANATKEASQLKIASERLTAERDAVRQALVAGPKLDTLRPVARKAGMRTLQEEGILLAAKGVTSLPELMRVLKQ